MNITKKQVDDLVKFFPIKWPMYKCRAIAEQILRNGYIHKKENLIKDGICLVCHTDLTDLGFEEKV